MLSVSRLLEQGQYSDVKFLVHGETFQAHRCVLSARSEYFTAMFETKWKGKNLIPLKHPLVGVVLHHLFQIGMTAIRWIGGGGVAAIFEVIDRKCVYFTL